MGCAGGCSGVDAGSKKARLVFNREQLLYDIKNCAYIEGHVWGEENQHAQHTLVEICEEGNVDRVGRTLSLVHAKAIEMLYPYTKEAVGDDEEICNRLNFPDDYTIELSVPATMSRTTLELLNRLIHEFMVARAIYDWLSITHPDAAGNWLGKANEAAEEIKGIKHTRTKRLRRPSHPF